MWTFCKIVISIFINGRPISKYILVKFSNIKNRNIGLPDNYSAGDILCFIMYSQSTQTWAMKIPLLLQLTHSLKFESTVHFIETIVRNRRYLTTVFK